jgi:rare lipoprotein A
LLAVLGLAGCGLLGERAARDPSAVPDAKPRSEPRSAFGNPPFYDVNGRRYYTLQNSKGFVERGVASWYGPDFHGKPTSSREVYDMYAMTAAHPSLPLPTYVAVTNLENGKRTVVRVNDRGPFHDNRVIDLSYTAASKLGIVGRGTGLVEVRAIDPDHPADLAIASGPLPPPGRKPDLYVQAGAFSSRENAVRLQGRLVAAAPGPARVAEASVQNRPLYRVRIGPLADVEEADRMVAVLAGLGIADGHIVVD